MKHMSSASRDEFQVAISAGRSTSAPQPAPNDAPVNDAVDHQSERSEPELRRSCQVFGIQNRQHVLADEITRVRSQTGALAQGIFKRRQRTDPARVFDQNSPCGGRKMQPHQPRPADDEKAAEHDECNKQKVDENDGSGGDAEDRQRHKPSGIGLPSTISSSTLSGPRTKKLFRSSAGRCAIGSTMSTPAAFIRSNSR